MHCVKSAQSLRISTRRLAARLLTANSPRTSVAIPLLQPRRPCSRRPASSGSTTPTIPLFPAQRITDGTPSIRPEFVRAALHVNPRQSCPKPLRSLAWYLPSCRCPGEVPSVHPTRQRISPEQGIPDTSAASALLPLHKSLLAALADPSEHLQCTQTHNNKLFRHVSACPLSHFPLTSFTAFGRFVSQGLNLCCPFPKR